MGVSRVIGSTTASDGMCYSKPLEPLIHDGACVVASDNSAVPATKIKVQAATGSSIALCKAACSLKGTHCVFYQLNGGECKLFNFKTAVKGNGDTTTGYCYMDPNTYIGKCKK